MSEGARRAGRCEKGHGTRRERPDSHPLEPQPRHVAHLLERPRQLHDHVARAKSGPVRVAALRHLGDEHVPRPVWLVRETLFHGTAQRLVIFQREFVQAVVRQRAGQRGEVVRVGINGVTERPRRWPRVARPLGCCCRR